MNVPQIFASDVFNCQVMQERLPKEIYKSLVKTIRFGHPLDMSVANVVANAMKDWAVEKGATHFTHWFQPMSTTALYRPPKTARSSWSFRARSS